MKRFLLDTGIAAHYVFRRHHIYDRARAEASTGNRIGICTPVLGELWYGVESSVTKEQNSRRLTRMLPDLLLWPFDEAAAAEFGRIAAFLKRIGRPMQQIDVQIAA